jgi:predicted Zn-dependent protease with MMP-like domain
MSTYKPAESIPLENRRAIFLTVVEAQDRGIPVVKSRIEVAHQFGVSEDDVKAIEREGLDQQWPPL